MRDFSSQFPILFCEHRRTTGLATSIRSIGVDTLCREYEALRKAAPRRSGRNKALLCRARWMSAGERSQQCLGEASGHCALVPQSAMAPAQRWSDAPARLRGSVASFELGHRSRRGGLAGVTDQGRLVVVELKVRRKGGVRGDTPLLALMECLRYAAVIRANHLKIRDEASECFGIKTTKEPPIVQILAPEDWWNGWCDMNPSTRKRAGQWEREFAELSDLLESRLGIVVECAALHGAGLGDVTWDAHGPRLRVPPAMHQFELMA